MTKTFTCPECGAETDDHGDYIEPPPFAVNLSEPFDFADAIKHKVTFYEDPARLKPEQVDPLIRDAVLAINQSGWVWTAESCQGHPDAADDEPWANNTRPFLRLVTRHRNLGAMLTMLYEKMYRPGFGAEDRQPLTVTIYRSFQVTGTWAEVLVYIEAATAWDRNHGIAAFERFARYICAARQLADAVAAGSP